MIALQDRGERVLIGVDAGADLSLRDEVGDGGDDGELPWLKLLRMPPHQADHANGCPAHAQRPCQPARSVRDDRRGIRARIALFIFCGRPDDHRAARPGGIGRGRGDVHRQVRELLADLLRVADRGDPTQPPTVLADDTEA